MVQEKKRRGRPPGPRKDGRSVRMVLAADVIEIADREAARYGNRTAAIEALVRIADGKAFGSLVATLNPATHTGHLRPDRRA